MTDPNSAITSRIERFVSDLSEVIRQAALEQVSDALGGGSGVGNGRAGRKAGAGAPALKKRAKGAKRSAEDFEALSKSIIGTVGSQPGLRADQLAEALGVETRELALPIKKLLAEKLLTKKGARRGTTYRVR
ncbi:MAG TPA: hypothetical protein VLC09_03760 [Polyangiaceae bacterium]|nr:hypothetical protein [Polyangiaceae bacterium]